MKEEVQRAVFDAKPMKAPGPDTLPALVWQKLWLVVQDYVFTLFNTSLRTGVLPNRWKTAKIIPLRKHDKPNYTVSEAYRPISLLSTLSKVLEVIVAERISYLMEIHGLLPKNHFSARKRRNTTQALELLQERIYEAWHHKKVLSLVSFDIKGA